MFASMFKTFFNKAKRQKDKKTINEQYGLEPKTAQIARDDVEKMLSQLDELKENSNSCDELSTPKDDIIESFESMSIIDAEPKNLVDSGSVDHFDDTKSEVSSIGEKVDLLVEDSDEKKTFNRINRLQCPFTWNIKPVHNKNLILLIQNKYGEYNMDISSPEFTFERYIGNLIVSYELFHKNKTNLAQMKVLEIGKWLEELDQGTDEFYLSINSGLKHVVTGTFIHMLFATNLTEECKWLLDDIVSFDNMNFRSKATLYAIRAAILTQYGGSANYLKIACKYAKKACDLDPKTSQWFYINSLTLTARRHFLHSYKSCPTIDELKTIHEAIMLSDGKNTLYNYHRMTLEKDNAIRDYHNNTNKNDKFMIEKNIKDNKSILQMVITIVDILKPKDPLLIVKCARTLITLPARVRDLNLAKLYMKRAIEMAPNDPAVLNAVARTTDLYKEMSKKISYTSKTKQNRSPFKKSTLGEDLGQIVKKFKKGDDPLSYLNDLIPKYNGHEKYKILAQMCSYSILFADNLRAGVEQFISLIEQPGIVNNYIITQHYSSFGSKTFNLAEFICNEIRLATNSNSTGPEDMLFYFKTLTKIMETCNLKLKDIDPSLKIKLKVDSTVGSNCSSTKYQNETDSSDTDSDNTRNNIRQNKTKTYKSKHLQSTGPKVFTKKPESNKTTNKTNDGLKKNVAKNNASKNVQSNINKKMYHSNTSNVDQLKSKMSKFLNTSSDGHGFSNNTKLMDTESLRNVDQLKSKMSKFLNTSSDGHGFSNNTKLMDTESLRNLRTQADIEQYTQQLYQNILTNPKHQFNMHNSNPQGFDRLFNQSRSFPLPNSQPPPLLSLRPNVNQHDLRRIQQQTNKINPKKK